MTITSYAYIIFTDIFESFSSIKLKQSNLFLLVANRFYAVRLFLSSISNLRMMTNTAYPNRLTNSLSMGKIKWVVIVMKSNLVLCLILITFVSADQLTVQPPTDDSYVIAQSPGGNYGSNTFLSNEHGAFYYGGQMTYSDSQSMIKFALPELPPGQVVASATVKCWVIGIGQYPQPSSYALNCCHLTSDWSESTVTAANQPGRAGGYGAIPLTGMGGIVEFNITSLVQNWYNGTLDNFGIGFHLGGSRAQPRLMGYDFYCNLRSKEGDATTSAMLIINTGYNSIEPASLGKIRSYWITG